MWTDYICNNPLSKVLPYSFTEQTFTMHQRYCPKNWEDSKSCFLYTSAPPFCFQTPDSVAPSLAFFCCQGIAQHLGKSSDRCVKGLTNSALWVWSKNWWKQSLIRTIVGRIQVEGECFRGGKHFKTLKSSPATLKGCQRIISKFGEKETRTTKKYKRCASEVLEKVRNEITKIQF